MNKKVLIIAGAAVGFLIIILILIAIMASKGGGKHKTTESTKFPSENLTLTMWYLFDDKAAYEPIVEAYQKEHKNVTINLVKKDPTEYETELINALAGGSGPDIFMIHNDWLPKHQDKLAPMPEDYMSVDEYKKTFAPVAATDLISDNRIYGIPFYIDTLALFYNNKLVREYNSALNKRTDLTSEQEKNLYISQPPQNWNDFIEQAKKLTKKNGTSIIQAGVALGTSNNVESSQDILSLLMLQNNTKMVSEDKKTPTFNLSSRDSAGNIIYPGTKALDFYTSFALPNKETYCWNSSMPSSTDAFIQEKAAMMFNYSYVIAKIKNLAPDLDYKIVEVPQVKNTENKIYYANYWPFAVSKNSKYPQVGWDFLKYASQNTWQSLYHQTTQRPSPKWRHGATSSDPFVSQLEAAISWYKGKVPDKVDQIFKDMITAVVEKKQPSQQAIDAAAQNIITLWSANQ